MPNQLPELSDQTLVQSLRSDVCPACGHRKLNHRTFCPRCYYRLPGPLRRALYRGLGRGYAAAVRRAMIHMDKTRFLLEPPLGTEEFAADLIEVREEDITY